jgi:hypothetical protein
VRGVAWPGGRQGKEGKRPRKGERNGLLWIETRGEVG